MPKIQLIYGLPAVLLYAGFAAPARADFVGISDPNASYLATTAKLDVTGSEFDSVTSLSDGSQTATFYIAPIPFPTALTIYDVGSGWFGWSSPPDSESDTPRVLGTTSQLEITLDTPSLVFGFEAERICSECSQSSLIFLVEGFSAALSPGLWKAITAPGYSRATAAWGSMTYK